MTTVRPSARPSRRRYTRLGRVAVQLYDTIIEDRYPQMAAAISYYTVFSLGPLFVLIIWITGFFLDPADIQTEISRQLERLVGTAEAKQIHGLMESIAKSDDQAARPWLSAIVLIVGATGVLVQLQEALNVAWKVQPKPSSGISTFLMKRIISFALILSVSFVLVVSLTAQALLSAVGQRLTPFLPDGVSAGVLTVAQELLSFCLIWFLFALMHRFMPDARISVRQVLTGSLATAIMFVLGELLVGLYLAQSRMATIFGASSSLVVILIWIYYASLIVLVGAGFNRVWSTSAGERIRPEPGAEVSDSSAQP